jgi:nucleoside-diphosphate-sugar epimerase
MRVVIAGASGNVGTSVLKALAAEDAVTSVLGLARRLPDLEFERTEWAAADIARDELVPLFRGADAVVHLAWAIQPSRDLERLRQTNVVGSDRVFRAVAEAGVPVLLYASSVGAYSPGPKDRLVDESWPTDGVPTSFYSVHKAEVERLLDCFEREHPRKRVVRLRPGLIFKREAASGIRRLFAGPFFPSPIVRGGRVPLVPNIDGLRFQAVHSDDVGEAYRLAVVTDARGPFNIAAEPVLDPPTIARVLRGRLVPLPPRIARLAADASWRLHLQPSPPGWLDLGLSVPLIDSSRAVAELGWAPRCSAEEALRQLVEGMGESAGIDTPPLARKTGGPARLRELLDGVGRSDT